MSHPPARLSRRAFAAAALAAAEALGRSAALAGPGARPPPPPRAGPLHVAMLLFPGMTALDLVGPQAVLAGLAPGSLYLVAREAGPVPSDTGLALVATHDFATCPEAPDVLFVPGGDGTPAQMRDAATLDFLRGRGARAGWVASVCTGSLILGAAGLLAGFRATSHWCVRDRVLPLLGAVPVAARTVFDGNRATGAGISAGLDLALALAARLRDADYARTSQLVLEYAPEPPFAAGSPASAGPAITTAADAILSELAEGALAAARTLRTEK